jgi:hypothetical protein
VPEHVVAGCLDQSRGPEMNGIANISKSGEGSGHGHGRKVLDGYLSLLSTGLGNGSGTAGKCAVYIARGVFSAHWMLHAFATGPSQAAPGTSVIMLSPAVSSMKTNIRHAILYSSIDT